jgi:hypothetical protein
MTHQSATSKEYAVMNVHSVSSDNVNATAGQRHGWRYTETTLVTRRNQAKTARFRKIRGSVS